MGLFDLNQRARPALKWVGGKSGPLPQLLEIFPTHFDRYVEPFLGGGAVFLALHPGVPCLLSDSNRELVEFYDVIRKHPRKLSTELQALEKKYSEKFYYRLRKEVPKKKIQRAARLLFLNKTGFNGLYRTNSRGQFNVPFGKRKKCPALFDPENLRAIAERLKRAELIRADFEETLTKAKAGDFIYCDPPYEPLSRTSSFRSYTAKSFTQEDQKRLEKVARAAAERGCKVAISNSNASFIRELYGTWKVHEISVRRAVNSKGSGRGPIQEIVATLGFKNRS